MSSERDSQTLSGIAASHGVAIARAVVIARTKVGFSRRRIAAKEARNEWERFVDAVCEVQNDLRRMLDEAPEAGHEHAILDAYVLMVGDEMLARAVHGEIHEGLRCADWAVAEAIRGIASKLENMRDPYLRERGHDVEFVGERLLRALGDVTEPGQQLSLNEPAIVIAHDLSPADTAPMTRLPVVGFVTEVGSRTSHTSIMARALGIPAVVGVSDAVERICNGDLLVVDGLRGRVIIDPTANELEEASRGAARYLQMARKLGEGRDRPAATSDGLVVHLAANIEMPHEAALARQHGAEGIGLYRTEYLYVDRALPPDEDDQLAVYRQVVEAMGGRPVTLRTFDIGGDKFVSAFQVPQELNPMLGLRAVRLALSERHLFEVQLRAMVRASAFGPVRILVPMVATLDELRAVRLLLTEAIATVRRRGEAVADHIALGAMIEVPGAAVMADLFAREAEFMSLGTNDLVQYALAIDRTNRALAYLASPFDPAILRLIAGVIRAGRDADCPLSLCGEMGGEPYGALLLVGMGMRELSMEAVALPEIKEALRRVSFTELEEVAERAMALSTAQEVERLLITTFEGRMHDLLTGQPMSAPGSLRPPHPSTPGSLRVPPPSSSGSGGDKEQEDDREPEGAV